MATKPVVIVSAALAVGLALAGCSSSEPGTAPSTTTAEETASATPEETPEPTPEPTAEATPEETTEPTPEETTDALPAGFPDPDSLVGKEAYDESAADGSWHVVVGGTPLDLVTTFGACFDGGTGDICGYSISGAVPPGPTLQPAEAGLLLLLRANGTRPDGSVTWLVVDAIATQPPSGEPEYFETCDGAPGVAIYADPDAPPGETIVATAAWGPDATISSLVEVDPATLSCQRMGD